MLFATVGDIMTFVGVVVTLVAAIVGLVTVVRQQKANGNKLQEIHVLVNSNMAAVVEHVGQLTELLEAGNIPVPEPRELPTYDPNKP